MKRKRRRRSYFAVAFNLPRKRRVKALAFGRKKKDVKARYDTSKQASRRRSHSRRSERFALIQTLKIRIMLIHRKRKATA